MPKPLAPTGVKVEAGAATVPLAQRPVVAKPGGAGTAPIVKVGGTGTAPMAKAPGGPGGTTAQLPKATVKLQQTVGLAKAPQMAPPQAAAKPQAQDSEDAFEEKDPEAGLMPLALLATVLAAALMVLSLFSNDKLQMYANPGDPTFLMSPAPADPKWEQKQLDGTYVSKFSEMISDIAKATSFPGLSSTAPTDPASAPPPSGTPAEPPAGTPPATPGEPPAATPPATPAEPPAGTPPATPAEPPAATPPAAPAAPAAAGS